MQCCVVSIANNPIASSECEDSDNELRAVMHVHHALCHSFTTC